MTVLLAQPKVETLRANDPERFRLARRVLSFLVWQLVALLLVEGLLYSAGIGEEEIFKLDPQVGFVHMTNKRITWRQEGMGAHSYFDGDGMREPNLTIAKPPDTYRIALLGDSLVEGLQVPIQDTFGQVLERALSQPLPQHAASLRSPAHKQVQVLNFGNSGYSTVQEYLQLKNKVFKYQPDLVILGYSSRDLFENWSPPDQAITNVRPFALHLPGASLVVDSSPVVQWMHTPRAKFLQQIGWLREHSRIWGLISAQEQQLTLNDPLYKAVCTFIAQPGKTIRATVAAAPGFLKSLPANFIASIRHAPNAVPSHIDRPAVASLPAAPNRVAPASNQNFVNLMKRTMGSLLAEMKGQCGTHNAKFYVLVLPSKPALCPSYHAAESGFAIDYNQEVAIVRDLCLTDNIPLVDSEQPATLLSPTRRGELFFNVHLRPEGHAFVAKVLLPIVTAEISK